MKKTILVLILICVCGVSGWFARQFATQLGFADSVDKMTVVPDDGIRTDGTNASEAHGRKAVVALGRVEPAGGVIDVCGTMGARLGQLLVEEGVQVEKGKRLAELESRKLRKLELDVADCQVQIAKQRLTVEQNLADVKIDAAELGIKRAEAAIKNEAVQRNKIKLLALSLALAMKDKERIDGLSEGLASDQERERQTLLVDQADSELASARAMMEQLELSNKLTLEAAQLELAAARAAKSLLPFVVPVDSLQIQRDLAAAMFDRTQIIAHCRGTVLKTLLRPGETIGASPLLKIACLRRMVVVAEVYEIEVKHLRVGQEAIITSKAFKPPFDKEGLHGTVQSIGKIISTPLLKNVDPFAPTDRHVVDIRVELDEQSSRQAAALTNLQVDVTFPKEDDSANMDGK